MKHLKIKLGVISQTVNGEKNKTKCDAVEAEPEMKPRGIQHETVAEDESVIV